LIEKLKKQIAESVAEKLMNIHGYHRDDRYTSREWDPNREDSQYSMTYEDAEIAVDMTIEAISNLEDFELEEDTNDTHSDAVTSSAAIFIFCDAGIGNPLDVKDVRQWLKEVDRAGIPDDTEVEGTLHLSYDIREPLLVERIECGECGHKDVLLTEHMCKAIEEHIEKGE
jgi:hypothetical protein